MPSSSPTFTLQQCKCLAISPAPVAHPQKKTPDTWAKVSEWIRLCSPSVFLPVSNGLIPSSILGSFIWFRNSVPLRRRRGVEEVKLRNRQMFICYSNPLPFVYVFRQMDLPSHVSPSGLGLAWCWCEGDLLLCSCFVYTYGSHFISATKNQQRTLPQRHPTHSVEELRCQCFTYLNRQSLIVLIGHWDWDCGALLSLFVLFGFN